MAQLARCGAVLAKIQAFAGGDQVPELIQDLLVKRLIWHCDCTIRPGRNYL
jgi:hypothetical protein